MEKVNVHFAIGFPCGKGARIWSQDNKCHAIIACTIKFIHAEKMRKESWYRASSSPSIERLFPSILRSGRISPSTDLRPAVTVLLEREDNNPACRRERTLLLERVGGRCIAEEAGTMRRDGVAANHLRGKQVLHSVKE